MLMPKRTKFRKMQKGRNTGVAQRGALVSFGDFGIKALEAGWITSRQIEAARIAMTRRMKRVGKVWIRIFPDKPITRKPGLSRAQQKVEFGEYGLKTLEAGWLTNRQIEAARIAMTRKIKRGGKVWINVYPDKPFTKKPAETRMGSGKGNPEGWVAVVKPGRVMFELAGVDEQEPEASRC
jgi:large subunit ribosomal protein L16